MEPRRSDSPRTEAASRSTITRRAVLGGLAAGAITGWSGGRIARATPVAAPTGQVIVVGAGVIGLSSAILLQEAGYEVAVWAAELTPHTTSDTAAAFWYPFHVLPLDEAAVWGQRSYETLTSLAGDAGTGVQMEPTTILFETETADPAWASYVPDFTRPPASDLPEDYVTAYRFTTPVVEMPIYLAYLMERFQRNGGSVTQRLVVSLEEPLAECPVVVNCTGLGARILVDDPRVFPIRGQVVHVKRPATAPYVTLAEGPRTGLTYIVYRSSDVVIGGTVEEGDWTVTPNPEQTAAMLAVAARIGPEIASAEVLRAVVGLRPGRDAVRLEAEPWGEGGSVVHCYGHGGGGVSLSWGCARVVVDLVTSERARLAAR